MPDAEIRTGGLPESLLDGVSLVVMSPGLSTRFGAAAPLVASARARDIEVVGEIELFARALADLEARTGYRPVVIGVTGTNGKTTTTTLVTKMAAEGGRRATAAGNIGPNAVTELDKALDAGVLPEVWVLELSSFQLDTTSSLKCVSAAVLNVTEDHLDWHGDMKAYAEAKGRIFKQDTVRVVNREDAETLRLAQGGPVRTFGGGEPVKAGEYGLARGADGLLWLSRLDEGASEPTLFCPEKSLLIAGRHNAMNALAALALIPSALRSPRLPRTGASRIESSACSIVTALPSSTTRRAPTWALWPLPLRASQLRAAASSSFSAETARGRISRLWSKP